MVQHHWEGKDSYDIGLCVITVVCVYLDPSIPLVVCLKQCYKLHLYLHTAHGGLSIRVYLGTFLTPPQNMKIQTYHRPLLHSKYSLQCVQFVVFLTLYHQALWCMSVAEGH